MNAEQWIDAFAAELGAEPPDPTQVEAILELASIAAHSSERLAAPVACWIAGTMGIPLERAWEVAEGIGQSDAI